MTAPTPLALNCIAALAILLFGLGLWISIRRFLTKDYYFGAAAPDSFMTKLVRAHGNTAEFAPLLALLILVADGPDSFWWTDAAIVGGTAARYLMVAGFLTSATLAKISPVKAVAAMATYAAGLLLAASIILRLA